MRNLWILNFLFGFFFLSFCVLGQNIYVLCLIFLKDVMGIIYLSHPYDGDVLRTE